MMEIHYILPLGIIMSLFYSECLSDTAYKLIRHTFNETLPCTIPNSERLRDVDIQWFVTNDTVTDVRIWPFADDDEVFWTQFYLGNDNSLVIKKAYLYHGGIYTCVAGSRRGSVEAVIFKSHCTFADLNSKEQLTCQIDYGGPTAPNVSWLGGSGTEMKSEKYQTPTRTTVITTADSRDGPFECRVSDRRLAHARTACYRGGRITDRTTKRSTTTKRTTVQTTVQTTTQSTLETTTQATLETTTQSTIGTTTQTKLETTTETTKQTTRSSSTLAPTTAEQTTLVTSPPATSSVRPTTQSIAETTRMETTHLSLSVTLQSSSNGTAGTQRTIFSPRQNVTTTTVLPPSNPLLWVIITCVIFGAVFIALVIAFLLVRLRKKQKKRDYLVEKQQLQQKQQEMSDIPVGIKWEKPKATDPMLVRSSDEHIDGKVSI